MTFSNTYRYTDDDYLEMSNLSDEPLPEYNPPLDIDGKPIFPGDVLCHFQDGVKMVVIGIGDGCFFYIHDIGDKIDNKIARKHPIIHEHPELTQHYDPQLGIEAQIETATIELENAFDDLIGAFQRLADFDNSEVIDKALERLNAKQLGILDE